MVISKNAVWSPLWYSVNKQQSNTNNQIQTRIFFFFGSLLLSGPLPLFPHLVVMAPRKSRKITAAEFREAAVGLTAARAVNAPPGNIEDDGEDEEMVEDEVIDDKITLDGAAVCQLCAFIVYPN